MRVAVVTPRFPPDPGGVEQYAAWVALTLRAAGHEVVVVATHPGRGILEESYDGIPVTRLGSWLTLSNTPVSPRWWRQVPHLLGRLGVDVVNAHAPVPGLADVTAFTSRVPVVLTYHSGSLVKGGPVDPLLRAYERWVLPRVFARAATLVSVSPVALTHGTGRDHVVPPGVDTTLFSPPAPGAAPRARRVLYAGRIERTSRWKGLQVLVDALPRLRDLVPDVGVDVVGTGDDVEALQEQAAALGVAELLTWHGAMPHHDLPDVYRTVGVTVLPSLTESESFGMTLVEAMACACPVVGSDVGGIPFLVRDGVDGVLVPPGDAPALARALAGVLTDETGAACMGAAGRDAATARWDWRHRAAETVRILESAAGDAGPDPRPQATPAVEESGRWH